MKMILFLSTQVVRWLDPIKLLPTVPEGVDYPQPLWYVHIIRPYYIVLWFFKYFHEKSPKDLNLHVSFIPVSEYLHESVVAHHRVKTAFVIGPLMAHLWDE